MAVPITASPTKVVHQPPAPQQLRIPTPQDLERMRRLRRQQQPPRRRLPPPQKLQQLAPPQRQEHLQDESGTAPMQQQEQSRAEARQWRLGGTQQQQPIGEAQQRQGPPKAPQWRLGGTQRQQQPIDEAPDPQQQQPPLQRRGLPQKQVELSVKGRGKDDLFSRLAEECDLEDSWRPQVLLLHELGLRPVDFQRLTESRPEIFQMGIVTMRRKLKYFQDAIGLSNSQLTRVIVKFPRILEYKSERTIRPRLEFLRRCGVEQDELAKVFMRAPMAMELRVKDTLEPRAAFLRDVLCLSSGALGKLIVRHPQVLTCTEEMMRLRVDFLLGQGLSQEEVGRAVLAHPQVLHYKIDSMQERLGFLESIGLNQAQVAACISRFPQLFSLNVEANLAPKWRYLVDYIRVPVDGVTTLCSYPAYFSLSLTNRVVPSIATSCTHTRNGSPVGAARTLLQVAVSRHSP